MKSKEIADLIKRWKGDPHLFVIEGLLIEKRGFKVTSQQEEGLLEVGKIVNAKTKKVTGALLTEDEEKYIMKMGVSIMAGHGVGKNAFMSWLLCWFLFCFNSPVVACTAPTESQIKNNTWAEVHHWGFTDFVLPDGRLVEGIMKSRFTWRNEKIQLTSDPGKKHHAIMKTTTVVSSEDSDGQGAKSAGIHRFELMILVDEVTAMSKGEIRPFLDTMTDPINFMVMCFNPDRNNCFAVKNHIDERTNDLWVKLQWNAEKCDRVTEESIKQKIIQYGGKDTNPYRIRVLGLPPIDSADTFIPYNLVQSAIGRDIEVDESVPLIFGIDVGRGGDPSIILKRQGGKVRADIKEFTKSNLMELAEWIIKEMLLDEPAAAFIDVCGMGWGVYDRIIQMGHYIIPVNSAEKADNEEKYSNLRSEMCAKVRKAFEERRISIPNDRTLCDELASVRESEPDKRGRLKMMTKKEMRSKGIRSPNKFDALAYTYKRSDIFYEKKTSRSGVWDSKEEAPQHSETTWMSL